MTLGRRNVWHTKIFILMKRKHQHRAWFTHKKSWNHSSQLAQQNKHRQKWGMIKVETRQVNTPFWDWLFSLRSRHSNQNLSKKVSLYYQSGRTKIRACFLWSESFQFSTKEFKMEYTVNTYKKLNKTRKGSS